MSAFDPKRTVRAITSVPANVLRWRRRIRTFTLESAVSQWRFARQKLAALPIDWANVSWDYVIALLLLVFVCSFLGTAISLKRTFLGCLLTSLLFGIAFMFWTYYPHHLPLPTLD